MSSWEAFYGPNVGYVLELYEQYLQNPGAVDPATRAYFEKLGRPSDVSSLAGDLARPATSTPMTSGGNGRVTSVETRRAAPRTTSVATAERPTPTSDVKKVVLTARLARSIREYGHLEADIDPLGAPRPGDPMLNPETHGLTDGDLAALPGTIVFPDEGERAGTALDAMRRLRAIYTGHIGYEFDHLASYEERNWLHAMVESAAFQEPLTAEHRRSLLERLTQVEGMERFLHTVYPGQKRFSIEGTDVLVPMLDESVRRAEETGIGEVLIGMAHRGRLNVLAHVLEKPYAAIFSEFHHASTQRDEAASEEPFNFGGDVKYHLGYQREVQEGDDARMCITLSDNPSHLEFVDPVIEGYTRAAQDCREKPGAPVHNITRAMAITIHGDAAFPGEGVVAETLNLSRLPGYQTGGTLHIIVNNQIGFTTSIEAGRSTVYASDLAKGFDIPIVHVNADDPEACLVAVRLAMAYRERFQNDFLIDLIGYRRWGHNEGDEPAFTQPLMYANIRQHPTVRTLFVKSLIRDGVVSEDEADSIAREFQTRLRAERDRAEAGQAPRQRTPLEEGVLHDVDTRVPADQLCAFNEALLARPETFTPNSKLERLMVRRREQIERPAGIDWGLAEILAFASILADGTPIRLSGQDAERGTFSQRHLVLHDPDTGAELIPLQTLPQARASFAVYNSPLSEAAVLGFEYGYSVHARDALVFWEAQYGDFANAGQVVIDQFITAARAKWQQQPSLTLLLPHGYEGSGPEHSSARVERFLQLAAAGNVRIMVPTTAAQYFHLLRLQAASLQSDRRPMIMLTPKSLLRRREASSSLDDLAERGFQPVLDDPAARDHADQVTRLVLCAGKVGIDLQISLEAQRVPSVAVARVEQLYPFPADAITQVITGYPHLQEIVWTQEEPRNMGAWVFMQPRLEDLLPKGIRLAYVGRPDLASVAEGSPEVHEREQSRIVAEALGEECTPRIETRGERDVD